MARGKQLEELLTTIVLSIKEAEQLTKNKIDINFLLNIVGSYITAKELDKLDEEHKVPAQLFDERIFPIVDGEDTLVEAEIIENE